MSNDIKRVIRADKLTPNNVPQGTIIKVDGVVIDHVVEVHEASNTVIRLRTDSMNNFIPNSCGDGVLQDMIKGQIEVILPEGYEWA